VLDDGIEAGLEVAGSGGQGADGLLARRHVGVFDGELDERGDASDHEQLDTVSVLVRHAMGIATHPFLCLDVVLDCGAHGPCSPGPHFGILVLEQLHQRLPETQGRDVVRIVDALDQRLKVLHGIALFLQAVFVRRGPPDHLLHRLGVGGRCRAAHQLLQHGGVELGCGRRCARVVERRVGVLDAPLEHVVDVWVGHCDG